MEFISKYNMSFVTFVKVKYNKKFKSFDDYIMFLWETKDYNTLQYYYGLEEDLKEYCEQQERKKDYGKSKN